MKSIAPSGRFWALILIFVVAFGAASGCRSTYEADTEWRDFQGEMVWVPRGMHGFWGIQTRKNGRVHPLSPVEEAFHQDGLPVRGELLLRPDVGSIRSWGRSAEVRNLQKAN